MALLSVGVGQKTLSLLSHCCNPGCASGWLQPWRSRRRPLLEGRWACSPACMTQMVEDALRRELVAAGDASLRRAHRIPLGLKLVEEGQLSETVLQRALITRNAEAAMIPLGQWLVHSGLLTESAVSRALGAQWGCPVFAVESWSLKHEVIPGPLAEASGAMPIRLVGGKSLYVAFRDGVDRTLCYALERVLEVRVIAGFLPDSKFAEGSARVGRIQASPVTFLEASGIRALAGAITRLLEEQKPDDVRLARVHELFWIRTVRRRAGRDLIAADILAALSTSAAGL